MTDSKHPLRDQVDRRTGPALVWIGPDPRDGSHNHVVAVVTVTPFGVHIPAGSKYRYYEEGEWAGRPPERAAGYCDWRDGNDQGSLLPWHRIDQVDWLDGVDEIEEYING